MRKLGGLIGITVLVFQLCALSVTAQTTVVSCGGNLPLLLTLNTGAVRELARMPLDGSMGFTSEKGVSMQLSNVAGNLVVSSLAGFGKVSTATHIAVNDLWQYEGLKITVQKQDTMQVAPPQEVLSSPQQKKQFSGIRGVLINYLQNLRQKLLLSLQKELQEIQKSAC